MKWKEEREANRREVRNKRLQEKLKSRKNHQDLGKLFIQWIGRNTAQ